MAAKKVKIGNVKGKPFTYDDFTPEQLAELRGKDGVHGDTPYVGVNEN